MAIITKTSSYRRKQHAPIPRSVPATMDVAYLDTTQLKPSNLKPAPPKAPWEITLFTQYQGRDDQPVNLDINISPTLQSYTKYNGVVMDVTAPLEFDKDTETDFTAITGSGLIPAGIDLLAGDLFIAKIGPDTAPALIGITSAKPQSFKAITKTIVDFKLIGFTDDDSTATLVNNLMSKVIEVKRYDPNALLGSDNIVVDEAEAMASEDLQATIQDIMAGYLDKFKDPDSDILLMPNKVNDNKHIYFDPNVALYTSKVFGVHLKDYARDVRTIMNTMFDRDDRFLHPVHTYMKIEDVANSWIRNHLNWTVVDKVVDPTKPKPNEEDYPLTDDELAYLLQNASNDPNASIDMELDTDTGANNIRMNNIIHRTLEGYNDKVDVELARTDGPAYPRIVRGIKNGDFDTITIGGINQDLKSDLNIYLVENGIPVYTGVLTANNYLAGIDTIIDYPLGKTYTPDEDHVYYIEINHPDPDRGTLILHHFEVNFNNGEIVNTVPGDNVVIESIIHKNESGNYVETTYPNARTYGTPEPEIISTIIEGDIEVIRVKGSNISFAKPLKLVVTQGGVTRLDTTLDPSTFTSGYTTFVDYQLPSRISLDNPDEPMVVTISSDEVDNGRLRIDDIIYGIVSDLGPTPAPVPLEGTIVITPPVISDIYHVDMAGEVVDTDIPNIRLNGVIAPAGTVVVSDGTFDTVRLALSNFDMLKDLTLSISNNDGLIDSFPVNSDTYTKGFITWHDFNLANIAEATEDNPIKVQLTSPTGNVGEVKVQEISIDMANALSTLPAPVDIDYPNTPVEVISIKHLNKDGVLEDTSVAGIRTKGTPPPMCQIVVSAGSMDTIRIRAVNIDYTSPLTLTVKHQGVTILEDELALVDYPLDYLATIDYSLPDRVDIYEPDELEITISSTTETGELRFYSMELGLLELMGEPGDPVLAFVNVPKCKYGFPWFYDDRILVTGMTTYLGECDPNHRSVLNAAYVDSIRVKLDPTPVEVKPSYNAFSALRDNNPPYDAKEIDEDYFKGPIIGLVNNDRYVFSSAFYDGTPPTTLLEYVVRKYLNEGVVEVAPLSQLVEDYKHWPDLEQYYYGPFIVHLARVLAKG